jgi:predicted protein tyrosine phosphatase
MIKHILVFPRVVIARMLKGKETISSLSWALISIYSTPKEQLITEDQMGLIKEMNCKNVLNLCVADATANNFERVKYMNPGKVKDGMRLFDESDAHKILDFVKIVNDEPIGRLVVHCDAGISRSGGVGIFLCRYLGLDEKEFRKINRNILPNNYIYDMLSNISGLNKDYEKYWNNIDTETKVVF